MIDNAKSERRGRRHTRCKCAQHERVNSPVMECKNSAIDDRGDRQFRFRLVLSDPPVPATDVPRELAKKRQPHVCIAELLARLPC
jgi:hypothetical protein